MGRGPARAPRAQAAGVFALTSVLALGAARGSPSAAAPCAGPGETVNVPTFHADPQRLSWSPAERDLTPARVAGPAFGPLWSSPPLDAVTLDGQVHPPRLYAIPLDMDRMELTAGPYADRVVSLVVAAWVARRTGFAARRGSVPSPGYA